MRVLLLRGRPHARTRVHAAALASAHPEIEVALARQGGTGGEDVEQEWKLGERPARRLREAISGFAPDVIHSYGPPGELTVCAIDLSARRIPVIHDLDASGLDLGPEQRAVEECDALVVASQGMLEHISSRQTLPPVTCVLPNYALARELPPDDRHLSAEANIDLLASLYQSLAREPLAAIRSR